ncbi:hypothetical protein P692DRAFT_20819861 [Suillus brevipes Sb2]|nr:hypothetical protein P692DRAFT_20819861 [Suillus brevipes Sb2]
MNATGSGGGGEGDLEGGGEGACSDGGDGECEGGGGGTSEGGGGGGGGGTSEGGGGPEGGGGGGGSSIGCGGLSTLVLSYQHQVKKPMLNLTTSKLVVTIRKSPRAQAISGTNQAAADPRVRYQPTVTATSKARAKAERKLAAASAEAVSTTEGSVTSKHPQSQGSTHLAPAADLGEGSSKGPLTHPAPEVLPRLTPAPPTAPSKSSLLDQHMDTGICDQEDVRDFNMYHASHSPLPASLRLQ